MPKPASRVATALAVGLLSSALPWAVLTAHAATVTACPTDQAGLVAAISGAGPGGTVAFSCDTTITLGSTIALSNVSIDGNGHRVTVSGNHIVQAFTVTGNVTLAGLDIVDGLVAGMVGYGGAVSILPGGALTVTDSTLSGNEAYFGGAISNQGSLTVANSTFHNNSARFGGAIGGWNGASTTIADSSLNANTGGLGGGGAVWSQFGTLTVTRSTLSSNTGYSGGAVETRGSTTTISNSTLSGNTAQTLGGGVTIAGGTFMMTNATLTDNAAASSGGNLSIREGAVVTVTNSILAGSGGPVADCGISNSTYTGVGGNLATDGTCPGSTQVSASAINLGPLADNGGPTRTRALLAGSAAIGAGVTSACAAAPVGGHDQRGEVRGATNCDSGAYDTGATVAYQWTGFLKPIDNETTNVVKAGGAVPVTFSLAGDQGLGAVSSTTSRGVACGASPADESVIATVAAGQSALSYDPVSDTYTYVWKTDKSWAGTCRQLNVTLADGTSHRADFVLR